MPNTTISPNSAYPRQHSLEDWLTIAAGAVIFGDKTGELIPLNCRRWYRDLDECIAAAQSVAARNKLQCRTLCRCDSCVRILIYAADRLRADLRKIPGWVWRRLGYRHASVTEDLLLNSLCLKWLKPNQIPHEIGFCLGYPVKDVLGYLNLIDLPCTGCCGWRVYGRPETSLRKKQRYDNGRLMAQRLVERRSANACQEKIAPRGFPLP